ncbi:serine/threonine-protein kinase [Serinicoccus sp. LYQ131]|uniref:serine/threonine-protein kinase n=1 Tax=Serinicoccus sp. LYQ131 TaxID=3378797 RepID=UPI00385314CE
MAEPHDASSEGSPDPDPDTTTPAPVDEDPTLVADRYRIVRTLGRGGGGHVWLATDEKLGRQVALKRVAGEADTQLLLNRGMREARTSATLAHEHVVRVYDAFEHEGSPWIVMEYVEGRSLAELIEEGTPLSPERAAAIGAQVATALAAAHRAGILHRDVKPANVLLADVAEGAEDDAKLTDFGIARADEDPQLTRTGFVSGTAAYFSPELARGDDASAASDVWALGASLYAAVEGERPFPTRSNAVAQLHTIVNEEVRPPRRSGALTLVLAGMLDPDPAARWDAGRAAQELRSVADGGSGAGTGAAAAADADHTQAVPTADPTRTFAAQRPARGAAAAAPSAAAAPAAAPRRSTTPAPPAPSGAATARRTTPPARRSMWLGWLIAVPLLALLGWLVWNIASGLDDGGGETSTTQDAGTPVTSDEARDLAEDLYTTLADDGLDAARALMTQDAWLHPDIADGLAGLEVSDLQATELPDGTAEVTAVVTYDYGAAPIVQDETLGVSRVTGELLVYERSAVARGGGDDAQSTGAPDDGR